MSNRSIEIVSDDSIPIDQDFRVRAGPGAGKTYWLAGHVVNVLSNSARLNSAGKIACLSYTNVAADRLLSSVVQRLGRPTASVESNTIHGFAYRNIVRPYLSLIKDEYSEPLAACHLVDGHQEHRPSYPKTKQWLESIGQPMGRFDWNEVKRYLRGIEWKLGDDGEWMMRGSYSKTPDYFPTKSLGISYKKAYWDEGILDHDDVLYFAHRILHENPPLRIFVAARWPYVFVDEFQDTNPVQSQIIAWLAESGSVVGVVGDPEQSIFGFQGATREAFEEFDLPAGIADYVIKKNRRSTARIVRLLNQVRRDGIAQNCDSPGEDEGDEIIFLVGGLEWGLKWFNDLVGKPLENSVILAWKNSDAAKIRAAVTGVSPNTIALIEEADPDRAVFLRALAEAVELAAARRYGEGIRSLLQMLRVRNGSLRSPFKHADAISDSQRRGLAVFIFNWVVDRFAKQSGESLLEFYDAISGALGKEMTGLSLKRVSAGKFKNACDGIRFSNVVASISPPDEARRVRTIHKAKGEEFSNVLVYFEEPIRIRHLLAKGPQNESQRISYVALSRAIDRLVILSADLPSDLESEFGRLDTLSVVFE